MLVARGALSCAVGSAVAVRLRCCWTAVALRWLCCCWTAVALLLACCWSAVALRFPAPQVRISPFLVLIMAHFRKNGGIRQKMLLIFSIFGDCGEIGQNKAHFWPYFLPNPVFARNKYHFWPYLAGPRQSPPGTAVPLPSFSGPVASRATPGGGGPRALDRPLTPDTNSACAGPPVDGS